MNYRRIYNDLIENRQQNPITEGYSENHHILPRSLGGSNNLDNLVKLSAREHFICHYLLAKIYKKKTFNWYKMNHAFMMMKTESYIQDRYFNSRLYESLRVNFSQVMSFTQQGKNNSNFGNIWIHNLELKKSKLIPKGEIPEGWIKGRKIKFIDKLCSECNNLNYTRFKYCSNECKSLAKKKQVEDVNYKTTKGLKFSVEVRQKMSLKMKEIRKTNKWISRKPL